MNRRRRCGRLCTRHVPCGRGDDQLLSQLPHDRNLRCEIEGQGAGLRREVDTLRADVSEVHRDLHVLSDRVARIEGALTGPWWPPANGGASNPEEPPAAPSEVPVYAPSESAALGCRPSSPGRS